MKILSLNMLHVSLLSKIIELYALWIKYELIPY